MPGQAGDAYQGLCRMMLRQLRPVGERAPRLSLSDIVSTERSESVSHALSKAANVLGANQHHGVIWLDSATAALAVALRAAVRLRNVSHPEVIIPAFACPDVVAAAVQAGVRPVLADYLPDSSLLDPRDVQAAISEQTVAVISVRLLGMPGNSGMLKAVIGPDIVLIEDCAHVSPTQALNTQADAVVLSFGRGKPVSLRGGGVLITNRHASLYEHYAPHTGQRSTVAKALRHALQATAYNQAISPHLYWVLTRVFGMKVDATSYRPLLHVHGFPPYLARSLPMALAHQHDLTPLAATYARMLNAVRGPWLDLATTMSSHSVPEHPAYDADATRLWRYPLLMSASEQRDQLFDHLWRRGLGPSRLYCRTLSEIAATAIHVRERAHPNARSFAARVLALPLHSDVAATDIDRISECLKGFAASVRGVAATEPMTALPLLRDNRACAPDA